MKWSEIINEIEINNSGHFGSPSSFAGKFQDIEPFWTDPNQTSGLVAKMVKTPILTYMSIWRDTEILAVLNLHETDYGVWQVGLTSVDDKNRRQGFIRLLFRLARRELGPICSDEIQSSDAKEVWKAIIQQPRGFNIVVWNPETDEKKPAHGVPDSEIWNRDASSLLLIESIKGKTHKLSRDILEDANDIIRPHWREWGPGVPDAWWQV